MWVVYRKSDRKVVGLSADVDVDQDPDKNKALQEVVKGLADSQDVSQFDAFQVKERGKGHQLTQALALGQLKAQDAKAGGLDLVEDKPDASALVVTTNAKDFHPVDKIPLLPGDGQSFLVVSIQKTDDQGKPLTRKTKDNDTVWLRTSNGTLREDGAPSGPGGPNTSLSRAESSSAAAASAIPPSLPREIRSVQLAAGTATFRIYSENLRRLATVHLLSTDPNQRGATVQVEFI